MTEKLTRKQAQNIRQQRIRNNEKLVNEYLSNCNFPKIVGGYSSVAEHQHLDNTD